MLFPLLALLKKKLLKLAAFIAENPSSNSVSLKNLALIQILILNACGPMHWHCNDAVLTGFGMSLTSMRNIL